MWSNKEANFFPEINKSFTFPGMGLLQDVPIAAPSPRAQPEVVFFWCQMKGHIFLIITPKFQLQIHFTLEVTTENVLISGIPICFFFSVFS